MPYKINKEKIGSKTTHKKILAVCDNCGTEKYVRKSWAIGKIKKSGLEYYCINCVASNNIKKARTAKMEKNLLEEYLWLCEMVFVNLYDDKSDRYIASKLDLNTEKMINIIGMARNFVADFLNGTVSDDVYSCLEHIENGSDGVDFYDWYTQFQAKAYLHLETLPRPDGIQYKSIIYKPALFLYNLIILINKGGVMKELTLIPIMLLMEIVVWKFRHSEVSPSRLMIEMFITGYITGIVSLAIMGGTL